MLDIEQQADELLAADKRDAEIPSNRFSWAMQSVIRKWRFILLVQAGIFFTYKFGAAIGYDGVDHVNLNLFMSDWALWIESLVGIGVFGQSVRDARVIRFLILMVKAALHIAQRQADMESRILNLEEKILASEARILEALKSNDSA